jgi:hypothetical protein
MVREKRIWFLTCDTTKEKDWQAVVPYLRGRFDLIIDDGSHVVADQIATARYALPLLAPDGIYVIEDVAHEQMVMDGILRENPGVTVAGISFNTAEIPDDRLVRIHPKGN